jgi:hypothetical protein
LRTALFDRNGGSAEFLNSLLEHDVVLREVVERLQPLINAPAEDKEPRRKIGFHQDNR